MDGNIIVAIIGGLSVAIPSVITTVLANKRNNDLIIYRIDELDEKVHKHNDLIDRMYKVENRISVLEEVKKWKRLKRLRNTLAMFYV